MNSPTSTLLPACALVLLTAWLGACSQNTPYARLLEDAAPERVEMTPPAEPPVAVLPASSLAPAVSTSALGPAPEPGRGTRRADFLSARPSSDARHVADWVMQSGDHEQLPFVIVDKVEARIHVFGADGRLRGTSPVLLGLARGDHSVPGIGERKLADILPSERTTPAGRFMAELGHNANGEDILWVDYDTAVSMHRVRAGVKAERRLQRLASPTPADNRVSYGCINVPTAFYDKTLKPLFKERNGVVYVLPETRPAHLLFGTQAVASAKPGR